MFLLELGYWKRTVGREVKKRPAATFPHRLLRLGTKINDIAVRPGRETGEWLDRSLGGLGGRLVGHGGLGGVGGVEDFLESLGGLFADEAQLEGARFVLAHVLLAVVLAEDVQRHVLEPHAMLGLAREPRRRL